MMQYVTFRLDGVLYGIEVNKVVEILRGEDITDMPLSPEAITGLMNLRGQITTLIDLRKRLMLSPQGNGEITMTMAVVLDGEALSLMVDPIGDVREIGEGDFEVPSDILSQEMRELILSACKLSDDLLLMLGAERVMTIGQNTRGLKRAKKTTVV